ncbi:anti-sigma-factor antagonist [Rubrobacter xylanophilus DSM 9941]|uniref:Anti-sigma factor antagonist n=1 Tax=Rubrobacter xylanophilus (strain DSM 9941 / JCM 11954 / NBRC 16129 / PRD-1) TaxID=266117 RepID=Q1ASP0_RUBXD|nr:STAS domain-containing protein [Rubrobacter xylanophilus]ABG05588.1 anti-sigma-factor antagonist [Rubrobacter xylanophilus DSM 9941]
MGILKVREEPGEVVVVGCEPGTALDAANSGELRERAGELLGRSSNLVFDMGGVTFLDSSAIGALVGLMRAARESGGDVRLARVGRDVRTIFELTRLDSVFGIYPSVAEAVRSFTESPGR